MTVFDRGSRPHLGQEWNWALVLHMELPTVCDKRRLQTCRPQTCRLADLQTCRLADLQPRSELTGRGRDNCPRRFNPEEAL